ncbi:MAG TPA: hypothetical protein VL614_21565 [Acetobacteraceae bacterium]|nr:hypothetical protein [Acetobacteraceae bacterium]
MIAQRIFAVLAAALLVGAVAVAMLGPPEVPLGQMVFMIDHDLMNAMRSAIETHLASWIWAYLIAPVMVRPAWLVPAALGLICAGMAVTLSNRKSAHRSHRRS